MRLIRKEDDATIHGEILFSRLQEIIPAKRKELSPELFKKTQVERRKSPR